MTDILPNESGSPMIDSIEQDPLGIETPDSEMNKSISSDDSIELNNSGNSEVTKSESNESPTTTAEIIIKKSPNQKKNYLLKNLKNSQQNSSVQITAPRTELNEQVVSTIFSFSNLFIFCLSWPNDFLSFYFCGY